MIEIRMHHDMLDRMGHETLIGRRLIMSMRHAGIPAIGDFALRGVERGVLMFFEHEIGGVDHHILRWREVDTDHDTQFKQVKQLKNGATVWMSGLNLAEEENCEL